MITEQQYPISRRWLYIRWFLTVIRYGIVLLFIGIASVFTSLSTFIYTLIFFLAVWQILYDVLIRANFHYALEEEFLTVKAGIIAKTEQHIPYSKMQNVVVSRSLWDQFFKLSNITVENASQNSLTPVQVSGYPYAGNQIYIPGLDVKNTEALKQAIVAKINEYKGADKAGL